MSLEASQSDFIDQVMRERNKAMRSPFEQDRTRWKVDFMQNLMKHIKESKTDLISLRKELLSSAPDKNAKKELNRRWVGAMTQLSVERVVEKKYTINDKNKEEIDLKGADLVIINADKKQIIGIQIKGFSGESWETESAYLFDASDPSAMEEMRKRNQTPNRLGDFSQVASRQWPDYSARLIYVLVDNREVDMARGRFYHSSEPVVSEALDLMLANDALTVMSKSFRVKA